jgi:hypothetical protein
MKTQKSFSSLVQPETLEPNRQEKDASIPILVVSCDRYQDVWHPFFQSFFKNWTDCPYPVHLVSNTFQYPDLRVSTITVGADVDYSSNLIKAVSQVSQEWLIFWVDDRPPASPVDTDQLVKLIKLAQSKNAGYLRLIPCNPPAFVDEAEEIGELPKGTRYRVSMTIALWKKSTLLEVLRAGETAWDIEKRGGVERSNQLDDKFYALAIEKRKYAPLKDIHLIAKGKLMLRGEAFLKQEGLLHHLEQRQKTTFLRHIYIELYPIFWNTYYQVIWHFKKLKAFVNQISH